MSTEPTAEPHADWTVTTEPYGYCSCGTVKRDDFLAHRQQTRESTAERAGDADDDLFPEDGCPQGHNPASNPDCIHAPFPGLSLVARLEAIEAEHEREERADAAERAVDVDTKTPEGGEVPAHTTADATTPRGTATPRPPDPERSDDVAMRRACPHCRVPLTEHNVAVWNAGYSVGQRHAEESRPAAVPDRDENLQAAIEALCDRLVTEADAICPEGEYDKKDKAWRVASTRRRVASDLRAVLGDSSGALAEHDAKVWDEAHETTCWRQDCEKHVNPYRQWLDARLAADTGATT